jgi:uncharacterized protein
MNIPLVNAKELNEQEKQVNSVINLFSEGATVPFIARYREKHTGGLDENYLRPIEDRLGYLTTLEDREQTVLKIIVARRN